MSAPEAPAPPQTRRAWLPALVTALFLVVVAAAAWQGPAGFEPRFAWESGAPVDIPTSDPRPTVTPTPEPGPEIDIAPGPDPTLGAITALMYAILGILVLMAVLRSLRSMRAAGAGATNADIDLLAPADAAPADPDARRVRTGLASALARLEEPGDARDAIVAAWVGLEATAAAAGLARGVSETQAEFAVRALGRTGAEEAILALLRIYENVRYGGRTPTGRDVSEARRLLREIREAWR
ncbi:DUF4129 domain-containing protein [Microbacterium sp. Marseille-Q6965]|uniref:DUF4129 domain-containing protein n=1 Tax=Microbacterium sp. Marseille-Q6965 TaxID=2965072 RepID=UPI0021B7C784|nr:DUF4129 domain-containing protein [Microbacterium sp. Marseille-Q6965]